MIYIFSKKLMNLNRIAKSRQPANVKISVNMLIIDLFAASSAKTVPAFYVFATIAINIDIEERRLFFDIKKAYQNDRLIIKTVMLYCSLYSSIFL